MIRAALATQHGPDKNLRLANLRYGIDLMAAILTTEAELE